MAYDETDSLLPKDKPAPEIMGSRPTSIRNVVAPDEQGWEEDESEKSFRNYGDISSLFIILILFVLLALLAFPNAFKRILQGPRQPQTLDEKVNAILSQTPLIGTIHIPAFQSSNG